MTSFNIHNITSGVFLGTYRGDTASDALDAMARDAGYESFAECCDVVGDDGSDMEAEEVNVTDTHGMVLVQTPDGFSIHAPGASDDDIANGDVHYLESGPGLPTQRHYDTAARRLA